MTSPTLFAGGFSLKRVHLSRNMSEFGRLGTVTFFLSFGSICFVLFKRFYNITQITIHILKS